MLTLQQKINSENKCIGLIKELGEQFLIAGCDKNLNKVVVIGGDANTFGCYVVGSSWQHVYNQILAILYIVFNGIN